MNITPETIAEMASMDRPQTPQQALQNLDNVASNYSGTREEHLVLRSAVRTLQKVVLEHARLTEGEGDDAGKDSSDPATDQ